MNKVYCQNCRWFENVSRLYRGWSSRLPDCKKLENIEETPYGWKEGTRKNKYPEQTNSDFNCSDYKRLWWKFWV